MLEKVIAKYAARGVNFNIRTAISYRDHTVKYIAEVNSEGHFNKEVADSPRFKFRTSAPDLARLAVQIAQLIEPCAPLLDKCAAIEAEMAAARNRGSKPNTGAATAMEQPIA